MTSRTPGKLKLTIAEGEDLKPIYLVTKDGAYAVAQIRGAHIGGDWDFRTKANAERLAHCWNCHEDLLAALKAMLAHTEPNYGIACQQSVWNVARKVIADAEGK